MTATFERRARLQKAHTLNRLIGRLISKGCSLPPRMVERLVSLKASFFKPSWPQAERRGRPKVFEASFIEKCSLSSAQEACDPDGDRLNERRVDLSLHRLEAAAGKSRVPIWTRRTRAAAAAADELRDGALEGKASAGCVSGACLYRAHSRRICYGGSSLYVCVCRSRSCCRDVQESWKRKPRLNVTRTITIKFFVSDVAELPSLLHWSSPTLSNAPGTACTSRVLDVC